MPLRASAQFLIDGASIQDPMLESDSASFIFEGGIAPIETRGASQNFLFHPIAAKSYCGDGVRDVGESCDTNDLASATCMTRGYRSGVLRCSATCTFNETACSAATSASSTQGGTGNTEPHRSSVGISSVRSSLRTSSVPSSRSYTSYSSSLGSSASSFMSALAQEEVASSMKSYRSTSYDETIVTSDDILHSSAPRTPFNSRWIILLIIDVVLLIKILLVSLQTDTVAQDPFEATKKKRLPIVVFKKETEEDDSEE